MPDPIAITASYVFTPIAKRDLASLREDLLAFGNARGMKGLVLLAPEGINGTVSAAPSVITLWKELLCHRFGPIVFKDSTAGEQVYRRFSVKIKPEIVAIKDRSIAPTGPHNHLTPAEWQKMLQKPDVTVIDTRNHFEVEVGKFRGAIDPQIERFSEFPEYVAASGIPKDRHILLYCTGGIRCEKAVMAMEKQGYTHVYQLEGGILGYLAQFPERDFEGECFVFDHRTAVDQYLRPSAVYTLCKTCGNPALKTSHDCPRPHPITKQKSPTSRREPHPHAVSQALLPACETHATRRGIPASTAAR